MEVHQLRYFCAIVQQGTFTHAAESEHVAQPSLSQQIRKLEDELGGKLFHRLPRAARLTLLGESFLPHALAILQEIRVGKAEARRIIELGCCQTGPESGLGTSNHLPRIENAQTPANKNSIHELLRSA